MSQQLLNELGAAKACLLSAQKKAAYDAELRKQSSLADEVLPPPVDEFPELEAPPIAPIVERHHLRKVASKANLRPAGTFTAKLQSWLRTPVGITSLACGLVTVLLLGVLIRIQTNYGTVKIEIPEGVSGIEVKVDGESISIEGLDNPLRLRTGPHELVVTGEDYQTVCQPFDVRRGNNSALTVTLLPAPIVKAHQTPAREPTGSSKPADLKPEVALSGKPSPESAPTDGKGPP